MKKGYLSEINNLTNEAIKLDIPETIRLLDVNQAYTEIKRLAQLPFKKEVIEFLKKHKGYPPTKVQEEISRIETFQSTCRANKVNYVSGSSYMAWRYDTPGNLDESIYLLLNDKTAMEQMIKNSSWDIWTFCVEARVYARNFLFLDFLRTKLTSSKTLRSSYNGTDEEFENDVHLLSQVKPPLIDTSNKYIRGPREKSAMIAWYDFLKSDGKFKFLKRAEIVYVMNNFFSGLSLGKEGRTLSETENTGYKKYKNQFSKILSNIKK